MELTDEDLDKNTVELKLNFSVSEKAELRAMEHAEALRTIARLTTEREACAQVCESLWHIDGTATANEFASAIRARNK